MKGEKPIHKSNKKGTVTRLPVAGPHEQFTVPQVALALQQAQGMVSVAARTLGCARHTVMGYKRRHPEIAQAIDEALELQLDVTELKLFQAIQRGEPWSICFFLKTKGRARGYIEKLEATGHITLEELVGSLRPRAPKVINGSDPGHTSDGGGVLARRHELLRPDGAADGAASGA
jgi:hypothetical protein